MNRSPDYINEPQYQRSSLRFILNILLVTFTHIARLISNCRRNFKMFHTNTQTQIFSDKEYTLSSQPLLAIARHLLQAYNPFYYPFFAPFQCAFPSRTILKLLTPRADICFLPESLSNAHLEFYRCFSPFVSSPSFFPIESIVAIYQP